jgi:ribosomal-protein-alanine N-acetyltransferase
MALQPTLTSDRLLLRPFTLADAPDVQRLAGDRDIASTTLNIPHPYEDGVAETWIGGHRERFDKGEQASLVSCIGGVDMGLTKVTQSLLTRPA